MLEDAIGRQLIADVPVCTLLSGGLDSSAMTTLAARLSDKRIRSFALNFVGYTENFVPHPMCPTPDGPYAQEVANFAGTDHTEIRLSSDELMDARVRARTLHAQDLPFTGGDIDGAVFLLFKAIRQHSKVVLSGEIADELFGGYSWFHDTARVEASTFLWSGNFDIARQALDPRLNRGA
ncbi:asparagine synthase-related protein [Bradyrhizobium ottawaense]|uniref:asparagine synthase-related protein n=1 Tax=Bradyrhizobium ottawaense TaxID=931866 RepID=UPI003D31A544